MLPLYISANATLARMARSALPARGKMLAMSARIQSACAVAAVLDVQTGNGAAYRRRMQMREILFRGKRTDNGEWVHGYYVAANHSWHKHGVHRDWIVAAACANGGWFALHGRYPVVTDTVGQFTGLTDKNGAKIFEGDILQTDTLYGKDDRCVVCYGQFQPLYALQDIVGFYLCWKDDPKQRNKCANVAYWIEEKEATCIGNIYDNPELMKED
jgi:uncharacterized phage protein (TIGR01671 family)